MAFFRIRLQSFSLDAFTFFRSPAGPPPPSGWSSTNFVTFSVSYVHPRVFHAGYSVSLSSTNGWGPFALRRVGLPYFHGALATVIVSHSLRPGCFTDILTIVTFSSPASGWSIGEVLFYFVLRLVSG